MNGILKNIYDAAPPLRPIFASGYGFKVRRWRYGERTDRLVEEALERERWSPERWRSYREERTAELLHDAAKNVPYYREMWQRRRLRGDRAPVDELDNWPVLTKEPLRTNPKAFLRDDGETGKLFEQSTSGSSGTPVTTWRSPRTMQDWYALVEARWRHWYGVSRFDRWGMLGGKVVVPFRQDRPPFWVWNLGLNQLYLSTFHLKAENARAYVEALRRYDLTYLYGYASSMYALAGDILELGLDAPAMKVAVSNAEPLHPHQREAIAEAFGCPVRDTYGMSEAVAAASECEHGSLHLWQDMGVVEVLRDDEDVPVRKGEDGRLVCTSWLSREMPLIRYEVGDRGALAQSDDCPCGRTLPILERIVGRLSDNLITSDGRRVFQMDHVFYSLAVREAQIVQEDLQRVLVRVVPAEGYAPGDERAIVSRLRERVGDVEVSVIPVERIEREPNGKIRAVISRVGA